jgi:elongation factor P--(R)-beta-lysine ligase
MLEWYTAHASLEDQMNLTERYITHMHKEVQGDFALETSPWKRFSIPDLFQELLGFNFASESFTSQVFFEEIQNSQKLSELEKSQIGAQEQDSFDVLFGKCLLAIVEPFLSQFVGCFVYGFPVQMSALASVNNINPQLVNRFECYLNGVEIANGYEELLSVSEFQLRLDRFLKSGEKTASYDGRQIPKADHCLKKAMSLGFTPCVGVALGFERLLAILKGEDKIQNLLVLPFEERLEKFTSCEF